MKDRLTVAEEYQSMLELGNYKELVEEDEIVRLMAPAPSPSRHSPLTARNLDQQMDQQSTDGESDQQEDPSEEIH